MSAKEKISTDGLPSREKLFHDEHVIVYEDELPLSEIHFWRENNRTIFTFERLAREKGRAFKDISLDEITQFVAEQDIHKLKNLAKSIERNGVQIPLIVLDDHTLLDGNRRYFACEWIRMQYEEEGKSLPDVLKKIPVWIIKSSEISPKTKLKVLAEENFIKDLKLPWSLDAQARAVEDYYEEIKDDHSDIEDVFTELVGIFGISRSRIKDLLGTLKLTKEFIAAGIDAQDQENRRSIVEEKFVYFWEFLNKTTKGNSKYSDPKELQEVIDVFFKLMALGRDSPIKNVKQIEPLAQSKRDKTAWIMLNEDNGSKLLTVVSIMLDKKEDRKAEDKIRAFASWLEGVDELPDAGRANLSSLITIINNILEK